MRYCKHTQWLGLTRNDEEVVLQNTDRLQTLLEDLPDPDGQNPSLFVFIGNRSKAMAVKELAKTFSSPPRYGHDPGCRSQDDVKGIWQGSAKSNGRRTNGEIHLHIHAPSTFQSRPLLLAEGDFPLLDRPRKAMGGEKCHETTSRQLPFHGMDLSQSADMLYYKLLSPFADVFCIFATDVRQFKPIVQHLAWWLSLGQASTLPNCTHPKLLIVTERSESPLDLSLEAFLRMLNAESTLEPLAHFSDIHVLELPTSNGSLSNKARHRVLFEQLLNLSDQIREARVQTSTLFSTHHFAAFWHYALEHITTSTEPFNFVVASRLEYPLPHTFQDHLMNFLQNIKTPETLISFAIPIIASSFLLDTYSPDMHFFQPEDIFHAFYKDICRKVCRDVIFNHKGSLHMILPSGFLKLLENEFVEQVESFSRLPGTTSALWHDEQLAIFRRHWLGIRSVDSCFACFKSRPQYGLPCGHTLCEVCVRTFGVKQDIWSFNIHHCFLCRRESTDITVVVKPPTATVRLLSIDGGGVRGIIPLMFLQALEQKVGLPYPVQDNFHYVMGTSSGQSNSTDCRIQTDLLCGIIALALGKNGWSIDDCIHHFVRLSNVAFPKQHYPYLGWLSHMYILSKSLVADGLYPAHNLEALLKSAFGDDQKILDCSPNTIMGIKIGITVSSMKPEPYIFTNYNGTGDREEERYGVLLGSAPIWEMWVSKQLGSPWLKHYSARSTSAAPGIFAPKHIAGLGKFQDGGLKHNNPIKLALKEIKALFPGDYSAKRSALKVSLGTGKSLDIDKEMYGSSSWWKDLWFFRLCRALWSSIDSQEESDLVHRQAAKINQKNSATNEKTRRGEYFQFNVTFNDREPRLDDSSKIPEMKTLVREVILHSEQLDRLAHCIIAELFVFELEIKPRRENGRYACDGYILCWHRAGTRALEALLNKLAKSSARFLLKNRTLSGSMRDRSSLARDGNFRKQVSFEVVSKRDLVSIQLQEQGSEPFHISGSPFSVDWLVQTQGLDRSFHMLHGMKRKRKSIDEASPRKRSRLEAQSL